MTRLSERGASFVTDLCESVREEIHRERSEGFPLPPLLPVRRYRALSAGGAASSSAPTGSVSLLDRSEWRLRRRGVQGTEIRPGAASRRQAQWRRRQERPARLASKPGSVLCALFDPVPDVFI